MILAQGDGLAIEDRVIVGEAEIRTFGKVPYCRKGEP
jgi:hypothetical protein